MFQFESSKVAATVTKLHEIIKADFADEGHIAEYAAHAVIAGMFRSTFDLTNALDHYYAPKWAAVIPDMVRLYDELVKHGHDASNEYEISSCDRYASFIPYNGNGGKVMFFRNQNMGYVVVLAPRQVYVDRPNVPRSQTTPENCYTMHVRVITKDRWDFSVAQNVKAKDMDWEAILSKCDVNKYNDKASDYFRYQDIRDRGYVVTVEVDILSKGEVFYKIERALDAHPNTCYILDELEAYSSMMNHTIAELNGEEYEDESED